MVLYLDSAIVTEARVASKFGWISGVTTNPTLLVKSDLSPEATLKELSEIVSGELYYQLTATNFDDMMAEAKAASKLIGHQIVLKIPATATGFQALSHLSGEINCSVTGIYHPAQAVVAVEAGAKYALAYVNRATRLLGDGLKLVREMAEVVQGSGTEILAASIKSPDEAVATLLAGANHLTLPFSVLQAMTTQELSEQTFKEFNEKGRGIMY
ncbi:MULTISPECIES: transaldolase family protein [Okeania]|uniref:Transaldolase n=1 Tax=Okeania hirsuta TaxID=1458930 RepID=A0A3N6NKV5_9CYAN|nr:MULTISPECIES: transaldolase family protein [Okeania]NES91872.1 transaldolase [Okeania sp. SIO2B9]RQH12261.1 transaldolase [Okeania hirsuta]RQH39566.1 transaldolase [Okeania hirsuta]